MMDVFSLAMFLDDLVPEMIVIEDRIILDRNRVGYWAMLKEVEKYGSTREAQEWINMVPVDDFLSNIIDDFDPAMTDVEPIRLLYERSWRASSRQLGLIEYEILVEVLRDCDAGDLIFRLRQLP